jgi:hypothetical protein
MVMAADSACAAAAVDITPAAGAVPMSAEAMIVS